LLQGGLARSVGPFSSRICPAGYSQVSTFLSIFPPPPLSRLLLLTLFFLSAKATQRIRLSDTDKTLASLRRDIEVDLEDDLVQTLLPGQLVRVLALRVDRGPHVLPSTSLIANAIIPAMSSVAPSSPEAISGWNKSGFSAWNITNRLVDNLGGESCSPTASIARC